MIFAASFELFVIGYNWIFLWIFSFLRSIWKGVFVEKMGTLQSI